MTEVMEVTTTNATANTSCGFRFISPVPFHIIHAALTVPREDGYEVVQRVSAYAGEIISLSGQAGCDLRIVAFRLEEGALQVVGTLIAPWNILPRDRAIQLHPSQ